MPENSLLVDGEWRPGAAEFEVVDPATLEPVGRVTDGNAQDAMAALDAACAAFDSWRAVTAEERGGYLRRAAAEIRARVDALAALLTSENGKPLGEARGELLGSARMLEWSAEEARRAGGRVLPPGPNGPGMVLKAPVGPALAISPWNFPASMLVRKIGLALAAGSPLIVKPAEQTPLIATELVRILHETGLPAGVLQSITTSRPAEVAGALLADPRLRKVSFTGSTEVGLGLLRGTGAHLRRTSLELGGHSPAIVFADADLAAAAAGVVTAKFFNAGQSCIAINRLYVHRSVHDELLGLIDEKVAALRVGHGAAEGTSIGPLIDQAGLDKVERHVADAVAGGAVVRTGGRRWTDLKGAFYEPTVLTGADDGMLISREETFGPVLPVYSFDTADEAVTRANATDYGLAAYLFGQELRTLWTAMDRLHFGVIGVNDPAPVRPELPFGGMRDSGQEREGGAEGIEAFLETKAIAIKL
ncbi:NAD-dependent succinate-semialdehyde dehydrogenase [Actinocrispum wychmicini]|uniref:Succinate-semialdehyde dehydrogenase/glutarate-semialdehyde dehydrogenase n=1 Tax=Actinocrispum wychmicini TaxID=1213861 RepID=A0A4R2JDU4_9PSEU|nr:NAD-dependent succinate-semialdehyde dehydrogenase [Actinocrispum wychmicini]TCO54379.1 succinate-semialdehyde dehydrogenase/glutarate-semialdehyde dehydrogenase [Actinocrispum wychmicini]